MSRGHVKGTKKEQPGSQDWYAAIAAETVRRLDAEAVVPHGTEAKEER